MIHLALSPKSPLYISIIFEDWVRRSQNLPLFIQIRFAQYFYFEKPHRHPTGISCILESIVKTLNTCIHRWSLVTLSLPSSYMSMLQGNSKTASITRGLALEMCPDLEDVTRGLARMLQGTFNVSPILNPQRLSLSAFRLLDVNIDCTNLSSFEGCRLLLQDCVEIMRRAPGLTTCAFGSIRQDDHESSPITPMPLLHTSLTSLQLIQGERTIFDHITCPSLRDLTLSGSRRRGLRELEQFVGRSRCSLTSFDAMQDFSEQDELIKFLKLTPSLQHLEISPVNDDFFEYLGETTYVDPEDITSAFLPHLQSFAYYGEQKFHWSSVQLSIPTTPPRPNIHRRPLNEIRLDVDYNASEPPPGYEGPVEESFVDIIDERNLIRLLDLIQMGFRIKVEEIGSGSLIDVSREYHGLL